MTDIALAEVRHTPLDATHRAGGARMVPFAGWSMPLQYAGIIAEHTAVRTRAGLFDVSHMGQLRVQGAESIQRLQAVLSNDLARIPTPGVAQYTMLLAADAGIEDDLIAYRVEEDELLLVVNAANRDRDAELLRGIATDESDGWAMFALQGPESAAVLVDRAGVDIRQMPAFRFTGVEIAGSACIVATTGYTGERGCELLVPADGAADVWQSMVADERVTPCGLGARDTLRLEACFPLHGNDIDIDHDPLSAGLGFAAPASADELPGAAHAAVRALRSDPAPRRLVPVRVEGRGIPRAGMELREPGGSTVGVISSGTMSPVLRVGIALAWIDREHAALDTPLDLDVRGTVVTARVAARPFVAGSPLR